MGKDAETYMKGERKMKTNELTITKGDRQRPSRMDERRGVEEAEGEEEEEAR